MTPGVLQRILGILSHRQAIYDLLFASAWSALKAQIEPEHGYAPAAMMVLHTWNQRLGPHGHVHALVPGGGPALDANRGWASSGSGNYLVDAVA